jgi:hypothetical protein
MKSQTAGFKPPRSGFSGIFEAGYRAVPRKSARPEGPIAGPLFQRGRLAWGPWQGREPLRSRVRRLIDVQTSAS